MMTLKLDGRNIEVLDAYMVNDDEGGLVLGFVVEQDVIPEHLREYCDGMRFLGHFEIEAEDTHLEFEGVGAIYKDGDYISLTVRYM